MLSRNFNSYLRRTFATGPTATNTTIGSCHSDHDHDKNTATATATIDSVVDNNTVQHPTDRQHRRHSIVIGGGFVGLSIALHLQQIGRRVTIIDSSSHIGSPQSCSYGNAGTMAMYANVPINNSFSFRSLVLPKVVAFFNPTTATATTDANKCNNDNSSPLSFNFNVNNSTQLYHLVSNFIPWSFLFLWNCRPSAIIHTSKSLGALLSQAESGWDPIWEQCEINVDNERIQEGYLILQRKNKNESSTTIMTSSSSSTAPETLRTQFLPNLKMKQLFDSKDVLKLEPNLNPDVCDGGAWYFEDGWCLTDPGAVLKELAHSFVNNKKNGKGDGNSGELRMGSAVVDIVEVEDEDRVENEDEGVCQGRQVRAILEDGTDVMADEIIIAAGAHSASLVSSSMGEFCPLETERGYSITFDNTNTVNNNDARSSSSSTGDKSSSASSLPSMSSSSSLLTRAVCDQRNGWIATPMADGLRVAGKVELAIGGGTNVTACPPTSAIFDQLEREAHLLLDAEHRNKNKNDKKNRHNENVLGKRNQSKDWLGFRPTMPDALPVIGRSKKLPHSVYYAFGHQHIGWTLGGITGKLISELVQDKTPSVDLTPYRLDRFHFLGGWWK